jgi:hypothetical protein
VHRKLGLVVKTKHLKTSVQHKYLNNLSISPDTPTAVKGTILDADALKDLLKQERNLSWKINCLLS